jgi:hypothetical protein
MLRRSCMLVFLESFESLYRSIAELCCHLFLLICIRMLVFSEGLENLYTCITESHDEYIICYRWVYIYVLPSGRLKHVYIFTITYK